MLNKPIGHAFNLQARPRSRVLLIVLDFVLIEGHELITGLREGERGVIFRLAKPWTPFCQEDVLIHRIERNVFPHQTVVTSLEGDEVIPHRRRNKQLMPQLPIFLVGAEKSVFVHLVKGDRIAHAFDALTSGGGWGCFLILNLAYYTLFQQKKTQDRCLMIK